MASLGGNLALDPPIGRVAHRRELHAAGYAAAGVGTAAGSRALIPDIPILPLQ